MKKRISSMVLALIVVMTLLPTTAFAAGSYLMQKTQQAWGAVKPIPLFA